MKKTPKEWKRKEYQPTQYKEKCCRCRKEFRREKMIFATDPLYFLGGGEYDPNDKYWYCSACYGNSLDEV